MRRYRITDADIYAVGITMIILLVLLAAYGAV